MSAAVPIAIVVDDVALSGDGCRGVLVGHCEIGDGGHRSELGLLPDSGAAAMGFDDGDAFCYASGVRGERFVFGDNVVGWKGGSLGDGSGFIGEGVAERVEDSVMPTSVKGEGLVVDD